MEEWVGAGRGGGMCLHLFIDPRIIPWGEGERQHRGWWVGHILVVSIIALMKKTMGNGGNGRRARNDFLGCQLLRE